MTTTVNADPSPPRFARSHPPRLAGRDDERSVNILRRRVDGVEHRGFPNALRSANARLLTELTHLALTRDRRLRHQRRDAAPGPGGGELLHLVGAADAVARHAFEVVVDQLAP